MTGIQEPVFAHNRRLKTTESEKVAKKMGILVLASNSAAAREVGANRDEGEELVHKRAPSAAKSRWRWTRKFCSWVGGGSKLFGKSTELCLIWSSQGPFFNSRQQTIITRVP